MEDTFVCYFSLGEQNNSSPPRDVHALIHRMDEYVTLRSKRDTADVIKVWILNGKSSLDCSGGSNTMACRRGRGEQKSVQKDATEEGVEEWALERNSTCHCLL